MIKTTNSAFIEYVGGCKNQAAELERISEYIDNFRQMKKYEDIIKKLYFSYGEYIYRKVVGISYEKTRSEIVSFCIYRSRLAALIEQIGNHDLALMCQEMRDMYNKMVDKEFTEMKAESERKNKIFRNELNEKKNERIRNERNNSK